MTVYTNDAFKPASEHYGRLGGPVAEIREPDANDAHRTETEHWGSRVWPIPDTEPTPNWTELYDLTRRQAADIECLTKDNQRLRELLANVHSEMKAKYILTEKAQ